MKRTFIVIFCAINLLCLAVVVFAAYQVTLLMIAEHRVESDAVDGITFSGMAAPAIVIASLANIVWSVLAVAAAVRRRTFEALAALIICIGIWCASIYGCRYAISVELDSAQQGAPADGFAAAELGRWA